MEAWSGSPSERSAHEGDTMRFSILILAFGIAFTASPVAQATTCSLTAGDILRKNCRPRSADAHWTSVLNHDDCVKKCESTDAAGYCEYRTENRACAFFKLADNCVERASVPGNF